MDRIKFIKRSYSYQMTEEMKTLRTNIQFCGADKKVIMVTSCIAGEGKSSIALELAKSMAELNKKVLLLDCDIRRSVMMKEVEGGKIEFGLTHVLAGKCELKDALIATDVPGLSAVFAGVTTPNPTELLASDSFKKIVRVFRGIFDYVIIDSAPLGMVIDAAIIAPNCDASVLLLEAGTIKYRLAQETLRKLRNTGCPVAGVVLNKVDYKKNDKY